MNQCIYWISYRTELQVPFEEKRDELPGHKDKEMFLKILSDDKANEARTLIELP